MSNMSFENLETAYALLANAIDAAGEENELRFFARLTLILAHELGDIERFQKAIEGALEDIRPPQESHNKAVA